MNYSTFYSGGLARFPGRSRVPDFCKWVDFYKDLVVKNELNIHSNIYVVFVTGSQYLQILMQDPNQDQTTTIKNLQHEIPERNLNFFHRQCSLWEKNGDALGYLILLCFVLNKKNRGVQHEVTDEPLRFPRISDNRRPCYRVPHRGEKSVKAPTHAIV